MIFSELMAVPGQDLRDEIIRATHDEPLGVAIRHIQPHHAAFFGYVAANTAFRRSRTAWRHLVGEVASHAPTQTTLGLAVGIEDHARTWRSIAESQVRYDQHSLTRDGKNHLIDALMVTGSLVGHDPVRAQIVHEMASHGARGLTRSEKVEAGSTNRDTWSALGLPRDDFTFSTFYRGLADRSMQPETVFLAAVSLVQHEPHSARYLGILAATSERQVRSDMTRTLDPSIPLTHDRLQRAITPVVATWDRPTRQLFEVGYATAHEPR